MFSFDKDHNEKIQRTINQLMRQGIPQRTATYAAAMGYMKTLKKK